MTEKIDPNTRIADLEREAEQRDDLIKQLRGDVQGAHHLVDEMREQVEDTHAMIESWIEVFDMQQDDDGKWLFKQADWTDQFKELWEENRKLVKDWNKFVGQYNREVAGQDIGRPLAASKAQVIEVRRLRKAGASLRAIADETSLGLRTVRTIADKDKGTDRTGQKRNTLRKREFDRLRAADFRRRKQGFDNLPKRIDQIQRQGDELVRAAKGLA